MSCNCFLIYLCFIGLSLLVVESSVLCLHKYLSASFLCANINETVHLSLLQLQGEELDKWMEVYNKLLSMVAKGGSLGSETDDCQLLGRSQQVKVILGACRWSSLWHPTDHYWKQDTGQDGPLLPFHPWISLTNSLIQNSPDLKELFVL